MPTIVRPTFKTATPIQRPRIPGPRIFANRGQVKVDGVFEGGGGLGTAYLGSLALLDQADIWFSRVAGNSAGAITATMVAAGYHSDDIEFLMSNFSRGPARPRGVPAGLSPVDTLDFLDFPTLATISTASRRKTLLWKLLKGQIIDEILSIKVPVPTRAQMKLEIVNALNGILANTVRSIPAVGQNIEKAIEDALDRALDPILIILPTSQPKLDDFKVFDTEPLRIAFADAVWQAIASVNPLVIITTQLIYEGSLFEGRVFYNTISRLIGAKVKSNENATVQFDELPIPLTLIGTNLSTGRMEVYSSATTPNMLVAEAARISMSVPVIFEPRSGLKVDGGLCSNLPAWLFSSAGDKYWPPNTVSANRPKIGFCLSEALAAPGAWGVGQGKFAVSGNPPRVDFMDVIVSQMVAKLKDMNLFVPSAKLPQNDLEADLEEWKILKVAAGSIGINQEESVRKVILEGMFSSVPYFQVDIPLLGFHAADFTVGSSKTELEAVAERGWFAARDALSANPTHGSPLITNPSSFTNPF